MRRYEIMHHKPLYDLENYANELKIKLRDALKQTKLKRQENSKKKKTH